MEEEDRCAEKGTVGPVVIEETCVKSAFVKVMGGGFDRHPRKRSIVQDH